MPNVFSHTYQLDESISNIKVVGWCFIIIIQILKWIKLLQTPHPLGFNDNIYHEGNISRLPDFDVFSLLDIRKRNNRSHGKRKNGNFKRKNKHVLSLSELSIILKHSG